MFLDECQVCAWLWQGDRRTTILSSSYGGTATYARLKNIFFPKGHRPQQQLLDTQLILVV